MVKIKFDGGHTLTGAQLYVFRDTNFMAHNANPFEAFLGNILRDFPKDAQKVPTKSAVSSIDQ